jgi:ParB-like chromosome segregation protein Spo0J
MAGIAKWTACPKAEWVLNKLGLSYTVATIAIAKIDWKATHANIGRTGRAVIQENVDDFALAMSMGAVFPMPIAIRRKNGFSVPAGVHRTTSAKQNNCTEIECYVLDEQSEMTERMIAIMTNRLEGSRVAKNEALRQGVFLVSEYGADPKQVADDLGLNHKTLADKIRVENRQSELSALGFDGKLSDATLSALSNVAANSKTLLATATVASKFNLTAHETRELAGLVAKRKTEEQQLAAIKLEEQRLRKTSPTQSHRVTQSTRTQFLRIWHSLIAIVDGRDTLESLQIVRDSDEHRGLVVEWKKLKVQIDRLTQ